MKFDGNTFKVLNDNPNNLIIVSDKVVIQKGDSIFVGHIIADEVQIQNNPVSGSVTANKFQYDDSNYENGNPGDGEYCDPRDSSPCGSREPPPPDITLPEICPLFTGPAQRWDGTFGGNVKPEIHIQNSSSIIGTVGEGEIGFDPEDKFRDDGDDGCDGFACVGNEDLMVAQPSFAVFDNSGLDDIEPSNGSYLTHGNYDKVTISKDVTLVGGEYFIEDLKITKDGTLTVSSEAILHLHKFEVDNGGVIDTSAISQNELFIFVESDDKVKIHSVFDLDALIVSNNEVELHKGVNLYGAITSPYIDLHDTSSINSTIPASCAPDVPPEIPEQCNVFPNAIQSWTRSNNTNSIVIFGGGATVTGTASGEGNVGFHAVEKNFDSQTACDGNECIADTSLLVTEPAVLDFNPTGPSINIGWTEQREPIAPGNYSSITLSSGIYELTGQNYDVGTFNLSGGGTLYVKRGTLFKVNQFNISGGSRVILEGEGEDSWLIWGENWNGQNAQVSVSVGDLPVDIFSRDKVILDGSTKVLGSVTANQLEILGSASVQRTTDNCEQPDIPDMCLYFPNVSQTWVGSEGDKLHVGGNENSRIVGAVERDSEFFVGYSQDDIDKENNILCEGQACKGADDLKLQEAPDFASMTFDNYSLGEYDLNGNETLIPGDYGFLEIDKGETVTLTSGTYNIQRIDIKDGRLRVETGSQVLLYVHKLEVKDNGTVQHDGNPENFYIISPSTTYRKKDGKSEDSKIKFDSKDVDDVIGYNFSALIMAKKKVELRETVRITGAVTTPEVHVHDNSYLINGVPDECLPPSGGNGLELFPSQGIELTCEPQTINFQVLDSSGNPTGSYTGNIIVTASGGSAPSFIVLEGSFEGGNAYKPNSDGLLRLNLEESTVSNVVVEGALSDSSSNTLVTGNYKFVAYKFGFSRNPTNIIAGRRSETLDVQPLQCEGNEPVVSDDYNGLKDVVLSVTSYDAPTSTQRANEVVRVRDTRQGNGWQTTPQSAFSLDFRSNSTARIRIDYEEAGAVSYTMSDEICIDIEGQDEPECRTYQGVHNIQSRPWTYALCSPISADMSGTSEQGPKFSVSGIPFALDAVPIKYVNNGSTSGEIDVSQMCGNLAQLETKNFYLSSAPSASTILEAELDTPPSGRLGEDGLEGVPENGVPNDRNSTGPLQFNALRWAEAGSIRVKAKTLNDANYLFEPIQPGYRTVGRFVPQQLVMLDPSNGVWTQWLYSAGHDGFAYMSQPITHNFKLQAMSASGSETQNYGLFNNSLISSVDYVAQTKGESPEIDFVADSRINGAQTWGGASWPKSLVNDPSILSISIDDFTLWKKTTSSSGSALTTTVDGPFGMDDNVDFGLRVSDVVDGVEILALDIPSLTSDDNIAKRFPVQPDFRYGRMHLNDVGGNTADAIRVPLKTEYWDGQNFVRNSDDNQGSKYDAAQAYCVQTIWTSDDAQRGSDASLVSNGEHSVDAGSSSELEAHHQPKTANERTQVRLWLRQGVTSPQRGESSVDCSNAGSYTDQPWLQYNWRNVGDEDPSTVVTFGTFRGNDRIIFRGERGFLPIKTGFFGR
ncbi:MSHA biogenesis protein mshQ [Vibrio ishigakensis]|uniref:MSHA biogenesis protein mshQ n=1 Tax=Vibrio ishigakensis TaxID=1481914 RepID=A0A0B8QK48_9VIBR|nr:MSHA biogenesis protein mshQ [Vibrio ishigakensis]